MTGFEAADTDFALPISPPVVRSRLFGSSHLSGGHVLVVVCAARPIVAATSAVRLR
jgi:hypothetical protein